MIAGIHAMKEPAKHCVHKNDNEMMIKFCYKKVGHENLWKSIFFVEDLEGLKCTKNVFLT